jgi:hypothetical protein
MPFKVLDNIDLNNLISLANKGNKILELYKARQFEEIIIRDITAVCKNRRLYAKNRETTDFPPRIPLKSTTTHNFIKTPLILKVSGSN